MKICLPVLPLLNVVGIMMVFSFTFKGICHASTINFSINPNCSYDCDKPWLIYGKKEGKNSTLHYLWSAVELPSFVMALTMPQTEIHINWTELQAGVPGGVYFDKAPKNTFGISFQTLILFNDIDDTGKIDNISEKNKKYAPFSEFEWNIYQNSTDGQTTFTFYSTTFRGKEMTNNSQISFAVTAYDEDGRGSSLPHLITTPFSSQIEIVLDHLLLDFNSSETDRNGGRYGKDDDDDVVIPISGFYYPRYAIDAIVVSDDRLPDGERSFVYEDNKSLDDEHTPGVFDVASITTEGARKESSETLGGYLQWRPVCYLTSDKDINYSTYPNLNTSLPPIDADHVEKAERSLFYVVFGNNIYTLAGFQTTVAFGLENDGFYTEHNYTEWMFSMGLGPAPEESFSTVMIVIISVAVGIPCALFIFGGAYLLFRKLTRERGNILITED